MSQLTANSKLVNLSVDEMARVSTAFHKSQAFKNGRDVMTTAELFVIIMAGQEMGLGPSQAVMNVKMIEGKPELSANIQAALIKASGKYDYRVEFGNMDGDDPYCELTFYDTDSGESIGVSRFAKSDAVQAGIWRNNYDKYPRNMLFARAVSNGAAWIVPDAIMVRTYHNGETNGEDPGEPSEHAIAAAESLGLRDPQQAQVEAAPDVPRETPDREPAVIPTAPAEPYHRPDDEEEVQVEEAELDYEPVTPVDDDPPPVLAQPDLFADDEDDTVATTPMPTTTMSENVPIASPAQVRLIHVKRKASQLTEERYREILIETTGVAHTDRVPKSKVTDLLDRLDAEVQLAGG